MSKRSTPKPTADEVFQALQRATAFHQRGMLTEAERAYRGILETDPDHFDALHLLGVVRLQQQNPEEAVNLIGAALRVKPDAVEALGNLAKGLAILGRDGEALKCFDQALTIRPGDAVTLFNRGLMLTKLARYADAVACYQRVTAINPSNVAAHYNLGRVLQMLDRHGEALVSFDKALAAKSDFVEALNKRGLTLIKLGRDEEALACYQRALAIRPDFVEALVNRGNAMLGFRRIENALASYDRALAIKPDHVEALNNRGIALKELKRLAEALASYDKALAVEPRHPEALVNRGNALTLLGRHEEALSSYDRALAIRPDLADAHYNRANALKTILRFEEALSSYDKGLALKPDHPDAHGMAEAALAICDWTRAARLAGPLTAEIVAGKSSVTPFAFLGYSDDPALQLQCARNYIRDRIPARPEALRRGAPDRHGNIRIAYLSADFHDHATAYLVADLFELHDRSRFDVLGISFGGDDGSEMRRRLVKAFDRFHDVRSNSDREAAQLLRDLNVDIAIDLKGHTQDARPEILSYRPAPIAVNYLGYPGTMGADFIDYIVADAIVAPFEQQPFYAEKIVHLPDCYQPNSAKRRTASRTPMRAEAGLPEDAFVFCCFNNNYKITAPVFDAWMRLLKNVPGSVLWLLRDNAGAERNLRREAEARGIDAGRLIFAGRLTLEEHLLRQRLADLFLDTLPINAHTTASDALWAGLPVVTCRGDSFVARVAASVLHAAGLPELVTHSLPEYEAFALKLATDPALMQSIRRRLEQNRPNCALFDMERFRRHIESAYATMWEICRRGDGPRSFRVAPI
jgi:protein O-GlcNAc transferase